MGADQRFDLIPDLRIAFDLSVSLHQDPGVPRVIGAIVGDRRIAVTVVAKDLRSTCVGRANLGFAVEEPVQLIEIYIPTCISECSFFSEYQEDGRIFLHRGEAE